MRDELLPLQKGIVYGPVKSRRLGNSLGVNLSPGEIKLCSLNCSYCQYSWTGMLVRDVSSGLGNILPAADIVVKEISRALRHAAEIGDKVDSITFSGNGEPTLHPNFPEIVDAVVALRDSTVPGARVVCLSNSTTLGDPKVIAALKKIDEPVMKLDTGDEEFFKRLNRPAAEVHFPDILKGLEKLDGKLTIQSLFVGGAVNNATPEALASYIYALTRIRPRAIQIYTLDRVPADRRLKALAKNELEAIKELVEKEADLPAVVYC